MKLLNIISLLNFLAIFILCIIIFKSSNISITKPNSHNEKITIYQSNMKYSMSQSENISIESQYAEFSTQPNSPLIFKEGVSLNIDDINLTPQSLILNRVNNSLLVKNIHSEGTTNLNVQYAHISEENKMTSANNISFTGPYPYTDNLSIDSIQSTYLKTNLKSLKQIQSRNKQVKGSTSPSKKNTIQNKKSQTNLSIIDKFTLSAHYLETPLGRLNVRIKLHQVHFTVGQQSISSNYAKYQSDRQQLVFYDNVKLMSNRKSSSSDYASLNLKTGLLNFNENSQPFPLKF